MAVLELKSVDYSINQKPILHQVNFSVDARETMAILGASGSGKSTILRIVLGLAQPDSGEVLIQDENINQVDYDKLVDIRKRIGIVFQEGALFDSLTVGENVGYYYIEHEHMTHAQITPRVEAMLKTVGLKDAIDMMPEQLSGGMRRRVAIARALIYQPKLILYDEPTTGLDPIAKGSILDLINSLKQEHEVSSVIVTHHLEDVAKVADRFIVIQSGSVVWQGTRKQFLTNQKKMLDFFRISEPVAIKK